MDSEENVFYTNGRLTSVHRQSENEKTPKSKMSESNSRVNNKRLYNMKQSHETKGFEKTQFSTPKNENNSQSSLYNGELSITNPFENQSTLDSLLHPSFSPSVFGNSNYANSESLRSPASFWSIDQIAVMKPTDIDLSKLHEQQNFVKLDSESEVQAQKAIDDFFANVVNMPSPWSSNDHPRYLAIISPSPAQIKKKNKPCLSRGSLISPSVLPLNSSHLQQARNKSAASDSLSEKRVSNGCLLPLLDKSVSTTTSTQTDITIPMNMDLNKILASYNCIYTPDLQAPQDETPSEVLSTSSLRRKLFCQNTDDKKENNNDDEYDDDDCVYAISDQPNSSVNNRMQFNGKSSKPCDLLFNFNYNIEESNNCSNIPSTPSTVDYHSSPCNSIVQSQLSLDNIDSFTQDLYSDGLNECNVNSQTRYSFGGCEGLQNKENDIREWENNLSEDISFLSPIKISERKRAT